MEAGVLTNIALSLILVAAAMFVFFQLLKRYGSHFTEAKEGQIRIIAQHRMALKSQLLLVETDTHTSLIAVSGDHIAPIWTDVTVPKNHRAEPGPADDR
jgi:flagellar biogenesis protein FliO